MEIAVSLCIILLNFVLNLTESQLLFTPVTLFILKREITDDIGHIIRLDSNRVQIMNWY